MLYPSITENSFVATITDNISVNQSGNRNCGNFKIYNMIGEEIKQFEVKIVNSLLLFDVNSLHPGMYYLVVNIGKNKYYSRFVKI